MRPRHALALLLLVLLPGCDEIGPIAADTPEIAAAPKPPPGEETTRSAFRLWTLDAGGSHSCGIAPGGKVYCWGKSQSNVTQPLPAPAPLGVGNASAVSAGTLTSCVVDYMLDAYCWGEGSSGQLGNGSFGSQTRPAKVAGRMQFVRITVGQDHTCALAATAKAYCWGNAILGQLGNGFGGSSAVPVQVAGGYSYSWISTSYHHTCAVKGPGWGPAYCWGWNIGGALGDGSTNTAATPQAVQGGHTFRIVSAGFFHTCGVTPENVGLCWGQNTDGALGDGTNSDSSVPVPVSGGFEWYMLSAGGGSTCGVTTAGEAYCWGANLHGGLGNGTNVSSNAPTPVAGGLTFTGVIVGSGFACGIQALTLYTYCWGRNLFGQLGSGNTIPTNVPVLVKGP